MEDTQKEQRSWVTVVPLCVISICALLHSLHFNHTCDDAYITFTYVQNFADGHGLVFNPGDRVLGTSNPAWAFLLYLLSSTGLSIPASARLLGSLFAIATLVTIYRSVLRIYGQAWIAVLSASFLASSGAFALWMFGGLETHFFAFAALLVLLAGVRLTTLSAPWKFALLGLGFGGLSSIHPEGVMLTAPMVALWLLRDRSGGMWFRAILCGATAAAVVAGLMVLAWTYYGDPLPNTYYAKQHPLSLSVLERGAGFTLKFILRHSLLPLLVPVAWFALRKRMAHPALGLLGLLVLGIFTLFYLRIGGDALVYYRFWVLTLPWMALMLADLSKCLVDAVPLPRRVVTGFLLAIIVVANGWNSFIGSDMAYLRRDDAHLQDLKKMAHHLSQKPGEPVIAANVVGILSFYSGHRILDMLGLNDRHIAKAPGRQLGIPAHESHDGAYVFEQRPDIILPAFPKFKQSSLPLPQILAYGYPSDLDLYRQDDFLDVYKPTREQVAPGQAMFYFGLTAP